MGTDVDGNRWKEDKGDARKANSNRGGVRVELIACDSEH